MSTGDERYPVSEAACVSCPKAGEMRDQAVIRVSESDPAV